MGFILSKSDEQGEGHLDCWWNINYIGYPDHGGHT